MLGQRKIFFPHKILVEVKIIKTTGEILTITILRRKKQRQQNPASYIKQVFWPVTKRVVILGVKLKDNIVPKKPQTTMIAQHKAKLSFKQALFYLRLGLFTGF